jgi:hypothetical protein
MAEGYVYFLHNPKTNLLKIGYTRFMPSRFNSVKGEEPSHV